MCIWFVWKNQIMVVAISQKSCLENFIEDNTVRCYICKRIQIRETDNKIPKVLVSQSTELSQKKMNNCFLDMFLRCVEEEMMVLGAQTKRFLWPVIKHH